MNSADIHRHLIGQQGSRAALNTPVLLIEVDVLDRNIAKMAGIAQAAGIALRPHAKTHKSAEIARRQIAAGAVGVCCAKLGEAEALSDCGIDNILITSPVIGPPAVDRLIGLARRTKGLMATVDHPDAVRALEAAREPLTLLVDIDPGLHRTGVANADDAVALARQIETAQFLTYGGVQFYCGSQQHIEAYSDRRDSIAERTEYLSTVVRRLADEGLQPLLVTGGGTGSHTIDIEFGVLNELQVGSYIFMDRQYLACDLGDGPAPFETSLMVDARVISANHPFISTVDAGFKAFATEAGPPPVLGGAPPGSYYRFMGDEHGAVIPPKGCPAPGLGQVVTFGAPHCDPTVNLYDVFHAVRAGTLVDVWPIEARGRGF